MRSLKFRFSLRTFLVVIALVACWLGYHLRIISQRREMLARILLQGGEYQTYEDSVLLGFYSPSWMFTEISKIPDWYCEQKYTRISDFRSWLGDSPIYFINLQRPTATAAECERIAALFPEAEVKINDPGQITPQEKKEILERMRPILNHKVIMTR